ncbi:hypothetical protein PIROE2DRAFT_20036, partial [Piromyces sp. E2]
MSTMLGIKKEFSKNFEEESETYLNSLKQFPKIQLEKTAITKGLNGQLVDEIKGNNLKDWTTYAYQKYFTFQSRQYLNKDNDSEDNIFKKPKQDIKQLENNLKQLLYSKEIENVSVSLSEIDLSKPTADANKNVHNFMTQSVLQSSFEDLNIVEIDQVYRDFLLTSEKPVVVNLLQLLEKIENEKASLKINNKNFNLLKPSLISEGIEELKSLSGTYNKNSVFSIIQEINSLNSLIEKIKDTFDKTIKNEGEKIWSASNEILSYWEEIQKKAIDFEITKRKTVNIFKDAHD